MHDPLALVLAEATRILDAGGFEHCVVGGLAVGVRAALRYTSDVDLAVAVADDAGAEAASRLFLRRGYRLVGQLQQSDTGRFATLRLQPPRPNGMADEVLVVPLLDLLFASSGIEPEAVASATPIEVRGNLRLKTAALPVLIAMKLLSESDRRVKDQDDLQKLTRAAEAADMQEVERLIDLVSQRGFDRKKDLREALAKWNRFGTTEEDDLPDALRPMPPFL